MSEPLAPPGPAPANAYQQPVSDVVAVLGMNVGRGLTNAEAADRLNRYGPIRLLADH